MGMHEYNYVGIIIEAKKTKTVELMDNSFIYDCDDELEETLISYDESETDKSFTKIYCSNYGSKGEVVKEDSFKEITVHLISYKKKEFLDQHLEQITILRKYYDQVKVKFGHFVYWN